MRVPIWLQNTANTISTKMAAPKRVTLEGLEGSICRTPSSTADRWERGSQGGLASRTSRVPCGLDGDEIQG